jgi:hypothetical protein
MEVVKSSLEIYPMPESQKTASEILPLTYNQTWRTWWKRKRSKLVVADLPTLMIKSQVLKTIKGEKGKGKTIPVTGRGGQQGVRRRGSHIFSR